MPETVLKPKQLRRAREALAISTRDAASQLGVRPEELEEWESGGKQPDVDTLESLANIYGRSLDYFLSEFDPPPSRGYLSDD